MNEAKMMKEERNDWMKIYHKILKGLEAIIDVQKQVKDMIKIVAETSMTITEMEDTILKTSTNNQVINMTNITEVSEDLRYVKFTNSGLSFIYFTFLFLFSFCFILFYFLFLEQLGLGLIGNAVTSVTT